MTTKHHIIHNNSWAGGYTSTDSPSTMHLERIPRGKVENTLTFCGRKHVGQPEMESAQGCSAHSAQADFLTLISSFPHNKKEHSGFQPMREKIKHIRKRCMKSIRSDFCTILVSQLVSPALLPSLTDVCFLDPSDAFCVLKCQSHFNKVSRYNAKC